MFFHPIFPESYIRREKAVKNYTFSVYPVLHCTLKCEKNNNFSHVFCSPTHFAVASFSFFPPAPWRPSVCGLLYELIVNACLPTPNVHQFYFFLFFFLCLECMRTELSTPRWKKEKQKKEEKIDLGTFSGITRHNYTVWRWWWRSYKWKI